MFGEPENLRIFDVKRRYIGDFKIKLVTSDYKCADLHKENVTLYILSDMLLVGVE